MTTVHHSRDTSNRCGCSDGYVVPPVEPDPRRAPAGNLVLEMRGLVVAFVMVDTEGKAALAHRSAGSGDLGWKEAGGDRGHHDIGAEVVIIGNVDAESEAGNLRVVPVDGESDRGVAEHAEVEGVVRVLPDVVAAEDQVLAEGLLDARMEFIAKAWLQGSGYSRGAEEKRRKNGVRAAGAGQHEVFVEGCLQRARVGDAEHGVGRLDGVGGAEAGFGLVGLGEAVVEIAADAHVEEPVAGLDLVFDVESKLLHVSVAEVLELAAAAGEIVGSEHGIEAGVSLGRADGCGVEAGQRIAVGIGAGRVVGGVDDAQAVVLAKEGLLVAGSDFEIVDALYIRVISVYSGVGVALYLNLKISNMRSVYCT